MKPAALVTGAGRGIGAAIALELSRRGHYVHLLGRNEANLREIQRSIPDSQIHVCDLSAPDRIRATAARVKAFAAARLEVLVNNAGVFDVHAFTEGGDDVWARQFDVNLMGPVRLTRELWPHFVAIGKGSIVNVSSTLGTMPTERTGAYSAIKSALNNWTISLAQEGGPHGIRVNAVSPGIVDTPIHPFHSLTGPEKEAALTKMAPLQPLGRIGRPEDVARAVAFLAGDESSWTTGANLTVDGGISIK